MMIDWQEHQRIIEAAAVGQRRRMALGLVLGRLASSDKLPGVDFKLAASALPPPAMPYAARATRASDTALLFSRPKVRAAVAAELRRLESSKLRGFVGDVADLLRAGDGHNETAQKLRECNDPNAMHLGLHFHPDPNDPDGGQLMLKPERERCWLRICPKCAKDHAARLRKRYEGRIQQVMARKISGCGLKHLVLTMPRSDNLVADLKKLHIRTKQLIKHFWGNKPGQPDQGAFATAEIGPKGGNVHVHAIVYGRYVSQADISDYWRQITGNSFVVWIKHISPSQAVREGLKYLTKLGQRDDSGAFVIQPADLAELHFALKGRRRVWCWGAFYGLADGDADAKPDDATTDPEGDCRCGGRMTFISVPEARALLLQFKGANNCRSAAPVGPGCSAGISAQGGPSP